MFRDLREFIQQLEKSGQLVRIKSELQTRYEIAAAVKYLSKNTGKACLFERVKGYDVPVVSNLLGSRNRLALALGCGEPEIEKVFSERKEKPITPRVVAKAPVQDVIIDKDIDIMSVMPVLIHHSRDSGSYMTSAFTIAKDPETGIRGMGLHRIQVKGKDTIGIFIATPPLSLFLAKAEKLEKPLEIAVVSGCDPVTFFTSCSQTSEKLDKLAVASGLAKRALELVKCRSLDLEVPAHAEFVLEGYIIPHRREKEGPFGETTGYYLTYHNPVAKIKLISHRNKPLYHSLIPFDRNGEEILSTVNREADALVQMQSFLPEVQKLDFRALVDLVIIQIDKKNDDDGVKALDYAMSNFFSKIAIVVDTDVDISDPEEINWALATRVRPDKDLLIKPDLPGLVIDPSTGEGETWPDLSSSFLTRTWKIGFDATKPLGELERYERVDQPQEIKARISSVIAKELRIK